MQPNTAVIEGLERLLANTYTLVVMTQNVHWNVNGNVFFVIHSMTEKQYEELFEAVDIIAEHIRSRGPSIDATLTAFVAKSSITPPNDGLQSVDDYLQHLIDGHAQLREELEQLRLIAVDAVDSATEDLINDRMREHDKILWMLRSSLKA